MDAVLSTELSLALATTPDSIALGVLSFLVFGVTTLVGALFGGIVTGMNELRYQKSFLCRFELTNEGLT